MKNKLLPCELLEQGILYFKVGKYDDAKICWEKSADEGIASSMFCLGLLCLKDDGKDITRAKRWFEKAEKAGHKNARLQLENLKINDEYSKMIDELFCQKKEFPQNIKKKIISFGGYSWYVLKEDNKKYLCVSQYLIDIRRFHNSNVSITWEKSEIRKWLNTVFFQSFSDKEKELIYEVEVENTNNPMYGTKAGSNTKDHIFLLSYEELIKYFDINTKLDTECDLVSTVQNNDDLIAWVKMKQERIIEASEEIGIDYSMAQGQAIGWWLRTPGANSNRVIRVNCHGAIRMHGRDADRCLVGIRPALWLEVNDAKEIVGGISTRKAD